MNLILEQMKASIWGYSLPLGNPRVPDHFYQKVMPKTSGCTFGDIADAELVKKTIEEFKPEIIFHLASHSSLNHSMDAPHYILRTNTMGALNVLEAARQEPSVKVIIVVTSDKVYRNLDKDTCYQENCLLGGDDPYSTSKVCQELLTQCYSKTFFENHKRAATARASNVIGPGDYNYTRLFPYLVEEFSQSRIPYIRNPKTIRPWQSVMDVVTGYLLLGKYLYEKKDFSLEEKEHAYNFGPSEGGFVTVEEMADMVSREFGSKKAVVKNSQDQIKHEAQILKLDSSKAMNELGWKPAESLPRCIRRSVEFVKKEQCGEDVQQLARVYVWEYLREWRHSR